MVLTRPYFFIYFTCDQFLDLTSLMGISQLIITPKSHYCVRQVEHGFPRITHWHHRTYSGYILQARHLCYWQLVVRYVRHSNFVRHCTGNNCLEMFKCQPGSRLMCSSSSWCSWFISQVLRTTFRIWQCTEHPNKRGSLFVMRQPSSPFVRWFQQLTMLQHSPSSPDTTSSNPQQFAAIWQIMGSE